MKYLVDTFRGCIIGKVEDDDTLAGAIFLYGGVYEDCKKPGFIASEKSFMKFPDYWYRVRRSDLDIFSLPVLGEMESNGYEMCGWSWTRGYVSRKKDIYTLESLPAGGRRKGQIYVNVPTNASTQYCKRFYFRKVDKK